MACVPGILLDEMNEDPPDVELLSATVSTRGEGVEVGNLGEDFTGLLTGPLVVSQELVRGHP